MNKVKNKVTHFVLNAIDFIVRDTVNVVPVDLNSFSMLVVDGNLMGINSENQYRNNSLSVYLQYTCWSESFPERYGGVAGGWGESNGSFGKELDLESLE
ncbi:MULTISPECIES: hypothetical protein [Brevibacillus]|uniref:hypothetical protein n=1 Tax=Brevibacillus TaxID=55080 RepID=UPI00387799E7